MKFVKNPVVEEQLERTEDMLGALTSRASTVVPIAKALAPVKTGDYRDGIQLTPGFLEDGRAVARLNAMDFKSGWIEFGTIRIPAHAVLRRAAEAAGFNVVDKNDKGDA